TAVDGGESGALATPATWRKEATVRVRQRRKPGVHGFDHSWDDSGFSAANPADVSEPDVHELVELAYAAAIHLEDQIVSAQAVADVADLVHDCNLLGYGLVAAELGLDGHKADNVESDPPRMYDRRHGDHALVDETIDAFAHRCFRDA